MPSPPKSITETRPITGDGNPSRLPSGGGVSPTFSFGETQAGNGDTLPASSPGLTLVDLDPDRPSIGLADAVRRWPKISAWMLALSTGILMSGYDMSIISNVATMNQFREAYGETLTGAAYIIPALWLGMWNASVPIGAIAGALVGGLVQDRFGRRIALAAASAITLLCVGAAFSSDSSEQLNARRTVFLAAKLVQGLSNGMMLCTVETYMSEVLPPRLRGPGLALYPIFTLLGQLIGAIVVLCAMRLEGTVAYRLALASQWIFAVAPLVVAYRLPESPAWLVRLGRLDAARKCHARLYSADHEDNFRSLQKALSLEMEQAKFRKVKYSECFAGKVDSRRTFITMLIRLVPIFFGLPLLASASYFLTVLGLSPTTSVAFILVGIVVGLGSNIVSFWTLSRYGRRFLLNVSLAVATFLWLSIGLAGCASDGPAVKWYTSVTMTAILAVVGVAAWPASHVVAVEASSLRLRARTQGIAGVTLNLVAGLFSIVLPYLYNPDAGDLGAKVGLVFGSFCSLAFTLCCAYIPEMKDRTVIEIDEMFELRLPARAFRNWRTSTPAMALGPTRLPMQGSQ